MNKLIVTIILALMALSSFAQDKPGWIYNKPKPTNGTYLYLIESAIRSLPQETKHLPKFYNRRP